MNPILEHALSEEKRLGLPSGTAETLIKAESGGYTGAKSPKGAIGLTQLLPSTAKELGVNPYDPYENITGGLTYYAQHLNKFKDPTLAAAAYNAGPNNKALVSGNYKLLPSETKNYMKQFGNLIIPTASADENVDNKGQSFQQQPDNSISLEELDKLMNQTQTQNNKSDNSISLEELDKLMNQSPTIPERTLTGALSEGFSNIIPSAGQAVINTFNAVTHPLDTAQGISSAIGGNIFKALPGDSENIISRANEPNSPNIIKNIASMINNANAFNQQMANRYGGGQEFLNTLATDPIGMAQDIQGVGALLKPAAIAAASKLGKIRGEQLVKERLPPIIAGDISHGTYIDVGGKMKASEYGNKASDVLNKLGEYSKYVASPVSSIGGKVLPAIGEAAAVPISLLSGIEQPVIAEAIRAGKSAGLLGKSPESTAFTNALRGKVPEMKVVDDAKNALSNMRNQMYDAYNTNMKSIADSNTPIDIKPILEDFNKAKDIKSFKGQEINKSATQVKQQVQSLLDNWASLDPAEYHTASGLDALKQQLGDLRTTTDPHTPSRSVVDNAYNSVKNQIIKKAPEYGKVMNEYSNSLQEINDIERELSLKEGANPATALRKLQSIMRNNANTSWGARATMGEKLQAAGAPYLSQELAGQAMSTILPRGLSRYAAIPAAVAAGSVTGGLGAGASLLASSPRIVGEASYNLGKGVGAIKGINAGIEKIPLRGLLNQLAAQQENERNKK
jgi:hypothetical protein